MKRRTDTFLRLQIVLSLTLMSYGPASYAGAPCHAAGAVQYNTATNSMEVCNGNNFSSLGGLDAGNGTGCHWEYWLASNRIPCTPSNPYGCGNSTKVVNGQTLGTYYAGAVVIGGSPNDPNPTSNPTYCNPGEYIAGMTGSAVTFSHPKVDFGYIMCCPTIANLPSAAGSPTGTTPQTLSFSLNVGAVTDYTVPLNWQTPTMATTWSLCFSTTTGPSACSDTDANAVHYPPDSASAGTVTPSYSTSGSYTVPNLTSGTPYFFEVQVEGADGVSSGTATATATTTAN